MGMMYVLWGHRPEQINEINTKHDERKYLPGITLPSIIVAYSSLEEALVDVNTCTAGSTDESVSRSIARDERNC